MKAIRRLSCASPSRPASAPHLPVWQAPYRCRPYSRHRQIASRAAATEKSADWSRLTGEAGVADGAGAPAGVRSLLLDELVQASSELQELCLQQLQLLTTALQLSLQAVLTSSVSIDDEVDEEALRQHMLADSHCLRSTVYCRAPASLQTGQLQLQLVAASGGGSALQPPPQQQQQQQQRFLFLGQDGVAGSSLADQEQWILEQQVIVLPDSGGLVLPLAHGGFLVGLLVVERCAPDQQDDAPAQAGAADASGGGGMPPPPACLLFRSAELQLLKQAAAVLALACAMDLRAALERVGAAYRQRQASALVQAAKKPLSAMRTLGTMLLPRLPPGEPDRDFAQGILEQGSRLQEVVQQLQAALHPSAAAAVVPAALLQAGDGQRQLKALPQSSGGRRGGGGDGQQPAGQWQMLEPGAVRPALPSSSIGSDYQPGPAIEVSAEEPARSQEGQPPAPRDAAVPTSRGGASNSIVPAFGSRASADLLNVLMPLLASAGNFAAVSGVSFAMADPGGSPAGDRPAARGGGQGGTATGLPLVLPAAEVAVGPGKLKRMLSQLIDGVIACAARGDHVQASVLQQQWQGRPGVAVTLCCCRGLAHGGGKAPGSPHTPMQPEFAFLRGSAAEAGGFFEVSASVPPGMQRPSGGALTATLWLPVVAQDAGWS